MYGTCALKKNGSLETVFRWKRISEQPSFFLYLKWQKCTRNKNVFDWEKIIYAKRREQPPSPNNSFAPIPHLYYNEGKYVCLSAPFFYFETVCLFVCVSVLPSISSVSLVRARVAYFPVFLFYLSTSFISDFIISSPSPKSCVRPRCLKYMTTFLFLV